MRRADGVRLAVLLRLGACDARGDADGPRGDGDGTRVANVVPGAACALPAGRCAIVVKLKGDTDDFGAARRRIPARLAAA